MPLEEFLKDEPPIKKSTSKRIGPSKDGTSVKEDTANMPDRQKIALLKKILQEKNVTITQQRATQKISQSSPSKQEPGDFLIALERFAEWIRGRTYLRGDIDTAKQMIANLVVLDPSLLPPSASDKISTSDRIPDLAEFLRAVKEHDSLHPEDPVLAKQEFTALTKKKNGKPLTSTDYRYLKALKEKVKDAVKKHPFYAFLGSYLEMRDI
ncbi:MAG TPA: hypothetical protein VKM55_28200 [Candidatus Lokiarchaeia archaeon]|nr:hypothetical protein [Candidatus Lokiarchaeia archaeon]